MMIYHLCAITLAYIIDLIIGDPPTWPHPVKWFGSIISFLEKKWNNGRSRKLKGVFMLMIIMLLVFILSAFIVWVFYQIHPLAGIFIEGVLIATTIAQKSLKAASIEVYDPLEKGDLSGARLKLSYIVGRDTDNLGESEIVRGTVETLAESTSDGITAPLFWAIIGGAPLALVYRAVNTCDSMVGYKNDRFREFGWASAKFDDVLNLIPSRITGFVMLLGNKPLRFSRKKAWAILFRDAKRHPSPNSGWCEAAVAALLGVQLGGINYYKGVVSNRAKMGEPLVLLQKNHILSANKIVKRTVFIFMLVLWIGGIVIDMADTWF